MKLCEDPKWLAVHFDDRTVLRSDIGMFSKSVREQLVHDVEVVPLDSKGHYRVVSEGERRT